MNGKLEIIAEISGCHGGKKNTALGLIMLAPAVGCTGVKFQCFEPERLAIKRAGHPRLRDHYQPAAEGGPTHQLKKLYQQIHTPREWFPDLITCANDMKITWHSSVFDPDDVTFLETLNCPRYKISSFETYDRELEKAVMRTAKPLIISVNQSEDYTPPPNYPTTVLHATDYAVTPQKANIKRLRQWAWADKMFPGRQWPWGLSDHTTTHTAAEIAVAFGARMIEWHIKDLNTHTPDDEFAWSSPVIDVKIERLRNIRSILYGDSSVHLH
jgi:pseudaminic acid synthase